MAKLTKKQRYDSLLEMVMLALQTGDYKQRHICEEIHFFAEKLMEEEIQQIRLVAAYERALLRAEMEILKLQMLNEIEQRMNKHQQEMAERINEVFRKMAQVTPEKLEDLEVRLDTPELNIDIAPERLIPEQYEEHKSKRQAAAVRMDNLLSGIVSGMRFK